MGCVSDLRHSDSASSDTVALGGMDSSGLLMADGDLLGVFLFVSDQCASGQTDP